MPLPTERTVTGKYVNPVTGEPYDGTNGQNYVIFEPVPDRWTDQTGNQILLGGGRVNLASDGTFAEDVVCTDVDGVLPEDGRLWRLRQYIGGTWAEAQYIKVPMGEGPLDISDLLSVDLCGIEYVPVPGPKGDPGQQGNPGPQGEPGLDGGLDTGITSGGDLTPSPSGPLAVDISPLVGRIVDYSTDPVTVTPVEVATTTTVELDSIAQTRAVTWLLMGADGAVFQQEARPSPEDRRNFLVLGVVVQDGGSIVLAQSIPTLIEQPVNQFYDFLDAIGAFNMSGNTISPHGADLMLDHSSGRVFSRGWNHFDGIAKTKNPHIVTTVGASPAPWVHVLRESPLTPSSATATVDVGHYDADGVLTPAVGGAVVHQLWIFPTADGAEIHVLQYGQQVFDSLAEAVDGAAVTPITPNPALPGNAVLLAYLAVTPGATDLSDPTQAQVIAASRFGGGSGSGGGGGGDVSGYARLSGAEFTGPIGTRMDAPESIAQYSRVTADTQDRFRRLSDGTQQWGDGTAPPDAELRRLAAGLLGFLGTDLLVGQEDAKAYRMRQSGEALDFEGAGADLTLSVYELANFASAQHSYLRLESATRLAHALGKWIFSDTPFGAAVHTLDGEANQLGFHGAVPVGQQTVTGDRSTGGALQSLLQALDAVGLISDTSTPGTPAVWTVNGEGGPNVTLDATDVGAIPATEKGAAGGVATLGPDGKVPSAQVPTGAVTSVNEQTGAVVLDAADVQAIPSAEKGAAGGVATLGTDGKVTPAQLPADAVTSVNSLTGDVVLDAEAVGALTPEQASSLYSTKDSLAFNAKEHGAVADGATDDQPVIQNLLNSAPAGSTVILPPGTYATGVPIVVPPGKTLRGLRTNLMGVVGLYDPQVCIKPLPTFTGVAAIRFLDQTEGGYAAISGEQRVLDLMLDGVNVAAGVDGIQAKGNIQNVALRDVTIARFPNSGIYCGLGGDNIAPYSWRMHRVMLDNNHAHGMYGDRMVDLTAVDCQAIGNWASGFMFGNSANSQLIGCRAEWNGNQGFYFTGDWGLGAGAGGALMSGCSTDRNGFNGVYVDVVGTNAPLVISNLMTRRDGRNGGTGGGGYAGVAVLNSTMPVVLGDWTNFPGTDDDGTQTNSPERAGSFTNCTHVQIDNAYLHAATTALHDGGGNGVLKLGANVFYGVGTTADVIRTLAPDSDTVLASEVGAAGGVASLGADGLVPASQLPSASEGALRIFSVLDYGAVGDGVTDDLGAFEATLTAAYDAGGGVVWIPGGRTYGISNYIHILTNTTVMAHGATIKGIANRGLAKLYRESDTTFTGYTGHSRIRIYGGIWDVNASDGTTGTVTDVVDAFLMGHNDDVLFRDVVVRNVSGAHAIDMTGSRGVRVINCRFEGFKDNTVDQSSGFREAIQLDFAISGSGINGSFDGTPSKDILIEGCYFGPSDRLGGFGRAIGSHTSASANTWCEDIRIIANRIDETLQEGIRAYAWKSVVIADNVVSGTGSAGIIVTGPDPAETGYTNVCQDITIHNNICAVAGASSPLRVVGFATARPTGIVFAGNRVTGSGSTGIYVSQADQPQITRNKISSCTSSSIYAINCSAPQVSDNQCANSGGASIGLDTCAGGHVTANVIDGSSGHGILVGGGSNVSVATNRIVGAAGSGIRATSSTVRPRIIGNTILRNGVAATWGLDVTASATDALILNNDLTGSSWPTGTAYNLVGTRQILDWTGATDVAAPGQNLVS